MELSCRTEYALLALLELTQHYQEGDPLQIKQIARSQHIPDRYLEQLLATLRRGGIVASQRGAKGGYYLAQAPWQITLLDVLHCLEGTDSRSKTESTVTTVEGAVVEEIWQEVYDSAYEILQRYSLQDLFDRRNARSQVNLMYYI
ncbi:Rrf2 family transcriptional regulator [Spirulina sp. CS-785/01]|uniref:RrF2 family transcriptional regulator n=1 Tax=Spirulina sp. CS-785/01 TaxID=3021716 RepID=UPI002330BBB3|nr:Rrf2 family transcriptional regulator [Spirulina sp. CS-785/01]MDB9313197.1 Rrf2 family transcriptional regulator [Spirulina sp. CS-785/01]